MPCRRRVWDGRTVQGDRSREDGRQVSPVVNATHPGALIAMRKSTNKREFGMALLARLIMLDDGWLANAKQN